MYRKWVPWRVKEESLLQRDAKGEQSKTLRLLNWNVHKKSHHHSWLRDFKILLERYRPNLISFQEYAKINAKSIIDKREAYSYTFMPNIDFRHSQYGLLNASTLPLIHHHALYSDDCEPLIKTPKAILIHYYQAEQDRKVTLVNVHMINFVKLSRFTAQLRQIEEVCAGIEGALILSGDFNTWSRKRSHQLERLVQLLELKAVVFPNEQRSLKPRLDHIFYRGVRLKDADILTEFNSSDHKPMVATFSLI